MLLWARDAQGMWWDMASLKPVQDPPSDESPTGEWLRNRVSAECRLE